MRTLSKEPARRASCGKELDPPPRKTGCEKCLGPIACRSLFFALMWIRRAVPLLGRPTRRIFSPAGIFRKCWTRRAENIALNEFNSADGKKFLEACKYLNTSNEDLERNEAATSTAVKRFLRFLIPVRVRRKLTSRSLLGSRRGCTFRGTRGNHRTEQSEGDGDRGPSHWCRLQSARPF